VPDSDFDQISEALRAQLAAADAAILKRRNAHIRLVAELTRHASARATKREVGREVSGPDA
jgi:hypothetical protein